jgi:large subunit ribosomal protein L11
VVGVEEVEQMAAAKAVAGGITKEVKGKVRLLVLSGEAKPGPAIGQALGPLGLNMAEFCKQFNATTTKIKPGIPIPVRLIAYKDRTFTFTTLTPPTTWFLKKCANIEKGSAKPVLEQVGKVTLKQIYEIALIKLQDKHVSHIKPEHFCRSIIGTARTMGIDVIAGKDGAATTSGKAQKAVTSASTATTNTKAETTTAKPASATSSKPASTAPTAKSGGSTAATAKDVKKTPK